MKKSIFIITLLGLLCNNSTFSQQFGEKHVLSTGGINQLMAVHGSDIDQDGDIDILAADKQRDHILFYENLGDASFAFEKTIGMMNWPVDVTTNDIDQDGDLDIFWAAWGSRNIAWNENLGNGNFSGEHNIAFSIDEIQKFEMHDLDRDGKVDILFNALGDNKLSWIKNLGNNTFGEPIQLLTENIVVSFCCKDIDLDDDLDILYSEEETGKSAWLVNNGIGGFIEERVILIDELNTSGSGVFIFDSDNDGDNDLVIGSYYDSVRIFFNNGQNVFDDTVKIVQSYWFNQVESFDFDNDADEDLIFIGDLANIFTILENIDGYNFVQRLITTPTIRGNDFFILDMNNDNLQDIVFGTDFFNYVGWVENSDDHFFEDRYFISSQIPNPVTVSIADFNNNGALDIFCHNYNFEPAFYINSGNGIFSNPLRAIKPHRYPDNYLFDDFNSDGYADILSYSKYYSDSTHFIFEINKHDSTFEIKKRDNLNNYYTKLFLSDYNSDLKNEIIGARGYPFFKVHFIQCNDSLQLSVTDSIAIPFSVSDYDISIADFNNDGIKDVLITDLDTDIISIVYAENGHFNTLPDTVSTDFLWLFQVIPAYINDDDYADLVYVAHNKDNGWFENIPGVGFVKHPFNLDKTFYKFYPIDINNDNMDEILAWRYNNLYLITDISEGIFNIEEYDYGGRSENAVITDIDYDGDKDFISISSGDGECAWLENLHMSFSVESIFKENQLLVYPNPTKNNFTVDFSCESPPLTLSIFNNLGIKVKSYQITNSSNQFNVITQNLRPGIYYLAVESSGSSFSTTKVLILE